MRGDAGGAVGGGAAGQVADGEVPTSASNALPDEGDARKAQMDVESQARRDSGLNDARQAESQAKGQADNAQFAAESQARDATDVDKATQGARNQAASAQMDAESKVRDVQNPTLDRPAEYEETRATLDATERQAESTAAAPQEAADRVEREAAAATKVASDPAGAASRASGEAIDRAAHESLEEHRATLSVDDDGIDGDVE
ncbi:MAG: hypothetical protein H6708_11520 [Kofleriaceae bacterium]|nr:hypothetical protein [Kofleriaceae bacterium]